MFSSFLNDANSKWTAGVKTLSSPNSIMKCGSTWKKVPNSCRFSWKCSNLLGLSSFLKEQINFSQMITFHLIDKSRWIYLQFERCSRMSSETIENCRIRWRLQVSNFLLIFLLALLVNLLIHFFICLVKKSSLSELMMRKIPRLALPCHYNSKFVFLQ